MSKSSIAQSVEHYVPRKITVRAEPVLRIQGYENPANVRPVIRNTVDTVVAVAQRVFRAEVYARHVGIESCGDGALVLETGTAFHSEAFSAFLSDCEQVVVFVVTVGSELDNVLKNFSKEGQVLEALFLETAGWLGVEAATKSFTQHLRAQAQKRRYRLTRRLGPGYTYKVGARSHEWALSDQKPLFSLFDGVSMSVRLLDSCAMIPKMSRSGLIGLRPQNNG
ncbi:MAG: hypothetical protein ACE5K1_08500 [Acidiferrobacterales bacterium]